MKRHMEFISVAEIGAKVHGPLIGLRQKHAAGKVFIEFSPQLLQDIVSLWQVLTISALPFHQVRHRVEPEGVNPQFKPELHHLPHLFPNRGIVVVEIGLVTEEAMPLEGFWRRAPRPVGRFCIKKDDAGALVPAVGVAPDIPIAAWIVLRTSRLLKPRALIRLEGRRYISV